MYARFVTAVFVLALASCGRPMTPAEKHAEEDYEAYHQKLMQERAEAEYRKTPAYQKEMEAKQAKEDAAWKAAAASITPDLFKKKGAKP